MNWFSFINDQRDDSSKLGFTLIEIIMVVVIMGIMTSIFVVNYGNWRTTVATAQVKIELNGAADAMEDARNNDNEYPLSVPSTFSSSDDVVISGGGSENGKFFCIDGTSGSRPEIRYYISSFTGGRTSTEPGMCGPMNLAIVDECSSTIELEWDTVSGGSAYTLEKSSNRTFSDAVIVVNSQNVTSYTATGLSSGTTYYFRVKANTPKGITAWSDTVSGKTL